MDAEPLKKVCNDTAVPRLERIEYSSGTPPERVFRFAAPRDAGTRRKP